MAVKWVRKEPGWYTSERGELERIGTEWFFWSIARRQWDGPYRSLAEAKRAAEV